MDNRDGEIPKSWFRSNRFFHTERGWFFSTREGTTLGPFQDQQEAQMELMFYLRGQEMHGVGSIPER